jgi:hypothetical protein
MRARASLVAVLAACGGGGTTPAPLVLGAEPGVASGGQESTNGPQETQPVPMQPAPAGFAEADAVSIVGGEIVTWSFAGGKVSRLGAVKLADLDPDDYGSYLRGDWADREHFFVSVPTRTVLRVTAKGITPVTVPPEAAFQSPRPNVGDEDENLSEGGLMEGDRFGLVVTAGAAYWSECPWGFPYDGWQCEVHVTAELWPDADVVTDGTGVRPRRWPWAGAKAPGFHLKELDEARVLGCTPPPGTKQKQTQLRGKEDDGEHVHTTEWVSASPPRLLVVWGTPGYADLVPSRWALHDGCLEKPLVKGETAEAGPNGIWIGDETVYRGADALGPIDGYVRLRPPT